jgi:hypothetical protein
MKMKKEYLILSGVIVVLLIFLILSSGKNKMSYEVPKLKKIEKNTINKIEITGKDKEIILTGKEENWKLMPKDYPAASNLVEDMLETIENLALTELASEKKDFHRYELDEEKKITVKAYRDDELVREFDIGKISSTYSHTFVKMDDDTRVYHARKSFRSTFDKKVADLRDKSVMTFDNNDITEVKIVQDGETFEFAKKVVQVEEKVEEKPEEKEKDETTPPQPKEPKEEISWVMPDGQNGDKSSIDSILSQLSNLTCDEFIEDKTKEDFQNPVYEITLKGVKDYTVQIFAKGEEEGSKYPTLSSGSPYPFFLSTYTAENIMKKKEDLLEKEAESDK